MILLLLISSITNSSITNIIIIIQLFKLKRFLASEITYWHTLMHFPTF